MIKPTSIAKLYSNGTCKQIRKSFNFDEKVQILNIQTSVKLPNPDQ